MPVLIDTEDIYSDKGVPLRLEFDLIALETYADKKSEGWIHYEMSLIAGKNVLVKRNGTIHDDDVRFLEKTFSKLPKTALKYEPLEPDFEFDVEYLENIEAWTVMCMIHYGEVKHAYYGKSAAGVRLLISHLVALDFAKNLKAQRLSLTNATGFKDYEAKRIDQSPPTYT